MNAKQLDVFGVIGFDGLIRNGLCLHPDGEHIVYPIGNKITIKNMKTDEQIFLSGHKNIISCLCISPRGNLIASGQVNYHGFKAMVIIWDYEQRKMKSNYEMHKVRVENVCFTQDERYLVSLGGKDDGCIVVWDIQNENPLCGIFADKEMSGIAAIIARTNVHNASFVTSGDDMFKLWHVDPDARKLHGIDIKIGKLKRVINCIAVDERDENIYCGTTSGDIIKARLNITRSEECAKHPIMIGCYSKMPRRATKVKTIGGEAYAGGVKNLLLLGKEEKKEEKIIVGCGDGTVELVEIAKDSSVRNEVKKLLIVPCIVTEAWNDGAIRAFSLNGGKLLFTINHAHAKSLSAITITNDDSKLISGGCDGQVRVWNAKSATKQLLNVLKEHMGPITSLHVSPDDQNLISSSKDGTCAVWDARDFRRKFTLRGNTMYMATCFVPSGVQVLTCGTDRKIAYWEILDGTLVREIEGSTTATLNAISVSPDGRHFLTGSDDFIVKLWDYRTADILRLGLEHAAPITNCAFAANGKFLVTVSADGAIIIWKHPFKTLISNQNEVQNKDEIIDNDLSHNTVGKSGTPSANA